MQCDAPSQCRLHRRPECTRAVGSTVHALVETTLSRRMWTPFKNFAVASERSVWGIRLCLSVLSLESPTYIRLGLNSNQHFYFLGINGHTAAVLRFWKLLTKRGKFLPVSTFVDCNVRKCQREAILIKLLSASFIWRL